MSQVMSAALKLLLATAALCALIMISTRQQNAKRTVSHRERREIVYPIMVFPTGTVFQVSRMSKLNES